MGKWKNYKPKSIPYQRFYGRTAAAVAAGAAAMTRKSNKKRRASRIAENVRKKVKTATGRTLIRTVASKAPKVHTDDLHSGKDRTKHVIVLGKSRGKTRGAYGHFVYHQENSETISTQTGRQTIAGISGDLYLNQIDKTQSGSIVDPYPNIYYRGLMEFCPNKKATGDGGVTMVSAGNTLETTRLFVKKITYEIQVVNPSNTPTDFVLYMTAHKKPVGGGNTGAIPQPAWNQLTVNPLTDCQLVIDNLPGSTTATNASDASGTQTSGTFGKVTMDTYGFSPFQLAGFRNLFKPLLKKEVNLAPGAYHKFEIVVYVNKSFSEEALEAMRNKNMTDIPGATFDIWGIVRGSPTIVRDSTGIPYGVNKSVTTSSAEIGWTSSRKVEGHYYNSAMSTKIDYTMNNFRTISGTTVGKILDITDQVVDQAYIS